MSLNVVPLKTVREVDRVVDLSKLSHRQYSCYDGGQEIVYQSYLAQNVNNSSIQITSIPPSQGTIIHPVVYAEVTYNLAFAGATGSGNLVQIGVADAPRAFPLSQTTNTLSAAINGQNVSCLLSQYFNALIRYEQNYDAMDLDFGSTPTQLDQCTDYSNLFGTNRSPFTTFGENVYQSSRGAFSGVSIVSNTPTSAEINLTVREPLFLPGFMYNKSGLINVQNLQWVMTFGDLRRVWSHDSVNGNTFSSLTVNITSFKLWYKFITPKILSEIPKQAVYAYHQIVPNNQATSVSVASGAQIQIPLSAINLQAIPKCIYLYVRKADSDLSYTDADSFFRIDNVTVNYMNRAGLLSSAPAFELHRICVENGYNGNFDMYNKYNGSVVCLRIGKDIGLSSLYASGQMVANQLSLTVTCTNISNSTITNPTLFCQVIYEGAMTLHNNTMSLSTSVLSNSDVLDSQLKDAHSVIAQRPENLYGGDLLQDGMQFIKNIVDTVQSGAKVGMELAPMIGLGHSGGGLVGGKRRKKRRGGEIMDRNDLNNDLEEYYE